MNDRRESTFRRVESISIIDLSFMSDSTALRIMWIFTEDFTSSDDYRAQPRRNEL